MIQCNEENYLINRHDFLYVEMTNIKTENQNIHATSITH